MQPKINFLFDCIVNSPQLKQTAKKCNDKRKKLNTKSHLNKDAIKFLPIGILRILQTYIFCKLDHISNLSNKIKKILKQQNTA